MCWHVHTSCQIICHFLRHWMYISSLEYEPPLVRIAQNFTELGPQWKEYDRHPRHMLCFEARMFSLTSASHGSYYRSKFILLPNCTIAKKKRMFLAARKYLKFSLYIMKRKDLKKVMSLIFKIKFVCLFVFCHCHS